jgi:hypothetical protein
MRHELHRTAYPPEEKTERNRQAQIAYRARHRDRINDANLVRSILLRQHWYPGDAENVAKAIKRLLGNECAKELREHLKPAAGGTKKKAAKADRQPR